MNGQTVMGKAPAGVAGLARRYGRTVSAFSGSVAKEAVLCNQAGIDAFFPILRSVVSLEEAMRPEKAAENPAGTAEQVFRLIRAVRGESQVSRSAESFHGAHVVGYGEEGGT